MPTLAELHQRLVYDQARATTPFSADIAKVQNSLFGDGLSDHDRFEMLRSWLMASQPCLFGRVGAKVGRLSYCILTTNDFTQGDEHVRDKIQEARRQWKRDAYRRLKSGFIIAALSPRLTSAAPDDRLRDFSVRLAELYLLTEVHPDSVYHDDIFLPLDDESALRWRVGVNVFAAAGDGRWWHDHRMPGGVALSMNSVGHMTRSSSEWNELPEAKGKRVPDTLGGALRLAMQTIGLAAEVCSGKATRLLDRKGDDRCPHRDDSWPPPIRDKDRALYKGWYHTDESIPTNYFLPDITRPQVVSRELDLDFTYLWDDDLDNPDHQTMALGEEVPR